jgi:hypothetical protein
MKSPVPRSFRLAVLGALFTALAALPVGAQTTVKITDEVVRPEAHRIGIHYSGGNYWDSPVEKRPLEMNFEGTLYRMGVAIDGLEGNKAFTTTLAAHTDKRRNPFLDIFKGATYHVLSGPDQWKTGKVLDIVQEEFTNPNNGQKQTYPALVLDEPFAMLPRSGWHSNGLLLEQRLDEGTLGRLSIFKWQAKTPNKDFQGYNVTESVELVQGDTAPETFGNSALLLRGSQGRQAFTAQLQWVAPYPPRWRVSVWAKARAGKAELTIDLAGLAKKTFPLTTEWARYEADFDVRANARLSVDFAVTGGDALIDDTTAEILGDKNPTGFRDVLVDLLREHRPGVMRLLHNTGGSAENIIKPALQAYSTSGSTYGASYHRKPGHHEFFALCDAVGADAWANLPGTLTREDMKFYLEWIAGPITTPGGALRAKLGRTAPWTDTLRHVYVEIGNEIITFGGTGYSGPDYWRELIATGKASPWDNKRISFMVDQQPSLSEGFKKTPNADLLNVHNYNVAPSMFADEVQRYLNTDELLAKYILASPYWLWTQSPGLARGKPHGAVEIAAKNNLDIVVYEGGNYHTTHGDAPVELRNKYFTGALGGLSMANNMLWIHKNMRVTAQNQFNLFGFEFTGHGAFGDGSKVRLWGQVLEPLDPAKRRHRPAYLGVSLANRLIYGQLVATAHEGADPTFHSTGLFDSRARNAAQYEKIKDKPVTVENVPVLYSYAFRDGARRSLILVSYDLKETRRIRVALPAGAKPHAGLARTWTLENDGMWANNEPESATPGVRIVAGRRDDFGDGAEIALPPLTMVGIEWYETAEAAASAEAR